MKKEDLVTNLELSKELKKLGVHQDSFFYYEYYNDNSFILRNQKDEIGVNENEYEKISAFTSSELGFLITSPIITTKIDSLYIIFISGSEDDVAMDHNEANARAKLIIFITERINKIK